MKKHAGGRPRDFEDRDGRGAPQIGVRLAPETATWAKGSETDSLRSLIKSGEKPDAAPKERRRVKGFGWIRYLLEDLHSGRLKVVEVTEEPEEPESSSPIRPFFWEKRKA